MIGGTKRFDDNADALLRYRICRHCWQQGKNDDYAVIIPPMLFDPSPLSHYNNNGSDDDDDFFNKPGRWQKLWDFLWRDRFSLLMCGVKEISVFSECRTFTVYLDTWSRSCIVWDNIMNWDGT